MRILVLKGSYMRLLEVKQYLYQIILLKWSSNKIKSLNLCLELSHPSNLIHFQLEQRKLNRNGMRSEWYRENKFLCTTQLSRAERGKISISPIPDWYFGIKASIFPESVFPRDFICFMSLFPQLLLKLNF